jgi:hypothetical protein
MEATPKQAKPNYIIYFWGIAKYKSSLKQDFCLIDRYASFSADIGNSNWNPYTSTENEGLK